MNMDDWWWLEAAMLRMLVGSGAESRAAVAILAELPSPVRRVEIAVALQKLEILSASAGMKLSPIAVQASLRFLVRQLANLKMGIPMNSETQTASNLAKKALQRFAHFLTAQNPDNPEEVFTGEKAYEVIATQARAALDKKTEITPATFTNLQIFHWCAGPELEHPAAELIKAIAEKQPASKKAKVGAGSASTEGGSTSSGAPADAKTKEAEEKRMQARLVLCLISDDRLLARLAASPSRLTV